jgi:hypothetical protein
MAKIKLKIRMGFPALFEPSSFEDGAPMFAIKGIIQPGSPEEALLDKTILEVATAKWGAKAAGILKSIEGDKMKIFFVKKEYCGNGTDPYAGFEDTYYISPKNEVQPLILDSDKTEIENKRLGRPYSGCWVVVQIDVYAQENKFGKGVRASLLGVQFWKDGDAFSGGTKAKADDFEDLSDTGADEAAEDDDLA